MSQEHLPQIPRFSPTDVPPEPPRLLIRTEEDVFRWHRSEGFQLLGLFIRRLNEAVVGHQLNEEEPLSESIDKTLRFLDTLESWIDEIPPKPTPQRFGNVAFREWGTRLEQSATTLLSSLLTPDLHPVIPHLIPYLITSFGSFGRIDYGSGHELSFVLFLLCLTLLRFYNPENEGEERHLVLKVFLRYLQLVWRLQDVYQLEPAGSHGVWGLDDYQFLTYLWGSAQLRNDPSTLPSSILHPPLPPTNLYFLNITRIHTLKHGGRFSEHSPQLYSIAVGVHTWRKVNQGMLKMYEAEVLAKRVVVQHLPLGGILRWEEPEGESHGIGLAVPVGRVHIPPTLSSTSMPPPLTLPPLRTRNLRPR